MLQSQNDVSRIRYSSHSDGCCWKMECDQTNSYQENLETEPDRMIVAENRFGERFMERIPEEVQFPEQLNQVSLRRYATHTMETGRVLHRNRQLQICGLMYQVLASFHKALAKSVLCPDHAVKLRFQVLVASSCLNVTSGLHHPSKGITHDHQYLDLCLHSSSSNRDMLEAAGLSCHSFKRCPRGSRVGLKLDHDLAGIVLHTNLMYSRPHQI